MTAAIAGSVEGHRGQGAGFSSIIVTARTDLSLSTCSPHRLRVANGRAHEATLSGSRPTGRFPIRRRPMGRRSSPSPAEPRGGIARTHANNGGTGRQTAHRLPCGGLRAGSERPSVPAHGKSPVDGAAPPMKQAPRSAGQLATTRPWPPPVAHDRLRRDLHDLGGLINAEATEEAQLNHLRAPSRGPAT